MAECWSELYRRAFCYASSIWFEWATADPRTGRHRWSHRRPAHANFDALTRAMKDLVSPEFPEVAWLVARWIGEEQKSFRTAERLTMANETTVPQAHQTKTYRYLNLAYSRTLKWSPPSSRDRLWLDAILVWPPLFFPDRTNRLQILKHVYRRNSASKAA